MHDLTRKLIPPLIAAAALLLVVRTFVVVGLVVPVYVAGSSMAPTFCGPGGSMVCPSCDATFRVGIDQWPDQWPDALARCVECDHRFVPPTIEQQLPGTRVWVDRLSGEVTSLARWQTVVFRCPEDASTLCIKRIVALPGEAIDFAEGDIWIDGNRVVKSLDQQVTVRVPVHRESEKLQYWQGDNGSFESDHWTLDGRQHVARLRFAPPLGHVTDDLPANQSLRHRTSRVDDLMFACRVRLAAGAHLQLSLAGQDFDPIDGPLDASVLWSTFDHRLLLAIDERVVWQRGWPQDWRPDGIELAATGGLATLTDFTHYRDIHYAWRANDLRPAPKWRLPADEFFVVGDNQSLSFDSRNWPHAAGLPTRLMVGVAVGGGEVKE